MTDYLTLAIQLGSFGVLAWVLQHVFMRLLPQRDQLYTKSLDNLQTTFTMGLQKIAERADRANAAHVEWLTHFAERAAGCPALRSVPGPDRDEKRD